MLVIKNLTDKPLPLENGVSLDPKQQLDVPTDILSPMMIAARKAGHLQVKDGSETAEERKEMTDAIDEGIQNMDKILR